MKRSLLLTLCAVLVSARAAADPVQDQVTAGKQLFETTCASSTCHGSGGAGGQAPKLTDRALAPDLVRDTILNGRPGTPMPSFKDLLYPDMQGQVIAYVLSISSGGKLPAAPVTLAPSTAPAPVAPRPATVMIGTERGNSAAGRALFFDATRLDACRTCHSFDRRGGPVGPDFAQTTLSAKDIFAAVAQPKRASGAYPAVTLSTKSGAHYEGIKRE
jgi:cytochrome c55X